MMISKSISIENQTEFAHKVGTSTGTVSMWVMGKRIPDPASCDRIADALGIDLDIVLYQAGHRPQATPPSTPDPSDPRTEILRLVKRVDWSDSRTFNLVSGMLRQIVADQKS